MSKEQAEKLITEVEIWRDAATASQRREEELTAQLRSLQSKLGRLTDEIERLEMLHEVKGWN